MSLEQFIAEVTETITSLESEGLQVLRFEVFRPGVYWEAKITVRRNDFLEMLKKRS